VPDAEWRHRYAEYKRRDLIVTLVRADDKRLAWLNILKDLLGRLHYIDNDERLTRLDPQIVFAYDVSNLENDQLAKRSAR
jgi:hypothetical protein